MGLRFNKTFKQHADPNEVFLENNPVFKSKLNNEKLSLVKSFEEKNLHNTGYVIARWKFRSLIMAPLFMALAFNIFNYADPVLKQETAKIEALQQEQEKSILES